MVEISNAQRDQAVRYLQRLADYLEGDDRTQVVNLCRLAARLANQLKKRQRL
jgi:hypothetical protein